MFMTRPDDTAASKYMLLGVSSINHIALMCRFGCLPSSKGTYYVEKRLAVILRDAVSLNGLQEGRLVQKGEASQMV